MPYDPKIQNRASDYIAQSNMAGWGAMMNALSKGLDEMKSKSSETKSLRSLFKEYGNRKGIDGLGDWAQTASLEDLQGRMKGFIMTEADQEKQKERQDIMGFANNIRDAVAQRTEAPAPAWEGSLDRSVPPWQPAPGADQVSATDIIMALGKNPRALGATGMPSAIRDIMEAPIAARRSDLYERQINSQERRDDKADRPPDLTPKPILLDGKVIGVSINGQVHMMSQKDATTEPGFYDKQDYEFAQRQMAEAQKEYGLERNLDKKRALLGEVQKWRQKLDKLKPAAAPAATPGGGARGAGGEGDGWITLPSGIRIRAKK